ncbi:MAG: hypothetical protein AAF624_15050 [Bacteroidota bacterium]
MELEGEVLDALQFMGCEPVQHLVLSPFDIELQKVYSVQVVLIEQRWKRHGSDGDASRDMWLVPADDVVVVASSHLEMNGFAASRKRSLYDGDTRPTGIVDLHASAKRRCVFRMGLDCQDATACASVSRRKEREVSFVRASVNDDSGAI